MAEKVLKDLRAASRGPVKEWTEPEFRPCNEQIKLGAILRIADSLERADAASEAIHYLTRRIRSLERQIAKMKKESP